MKIAIEVAYTATATSIVELPNGKTWDDVEEYYVKWGTLNLKFKDEPWIELPDIIGIVDTDTIDHKRPDYTNVYAVDEHGDIDYDELIGEQY